MIPNELSQYIKQQLEAGYTCETIRQALLDSGWDSTLVEEGLAASNETGAINDATSSFSGQSILEKQEESENTGQEGALDQLSEFKPEPPEEKISLAFPGGVNGDLPPELKRWNWGAFCLSFIWGIANKVYLSLLILVPGLGQLFALPIMIVLGIKGNVWAWRKRHFADAQEFKTVQKTWAKWGIILFIIQLLLLGVAVIFGYPRIKDKLPQAVTSTVTPVQIISNLEDSNYRHADANYSFLNIFSDVDLGLTVLLPKDFAFDIAAVGQDNPDGLKGCAFAHLGSDIDPCREGELPVIATANYLISVKLYKAESTGIEKARAGLVAEKDVQVDGKSGKLYAVAKENFSDTTFYKRSVEFVNDDTVYYFTLYSPGYTLQDDWNNQQAVFNRFLKDLDFLK